MNSENIMKAYFDLLSDVYDEFNFGNHPESIYNMDETEVPLEPHPPKGNSQMGSEKGSLVHLRAEIPNNRNRVSHFFF